MLILLILLFRQNPSMTMLNQKLSASTMVLALLVGNTGSEFFAAKAVMHLVAGTVYHKLFFNNSA